MCFLIDFLVVNWKYMTVVVWFSVYLEWLQLYSYFSITNIISEPNSLMKVHNQMMVLPMYKALLKMMTVINEFSKQEYNLTSNV